MTTLEIKRKRNLIGKANEEDVEQIIQKGFTVYCIGCSVAYKSVPPNKLCKCGSNVLADLKTEAYV